MELKKRNAIFFRGVCISRGSSRGINVVTYGAVPAIPSLYNFRLCFFLLHCYFLRPMTVFVFFPPLNLCEGSFFVIA